MSSSLVPKKKNKILAVVLKIWRLRQHLKNKELNQQYTFIDIRKVWYKKSSHSLQKVELLFQLQVNVYKAKLKAGENSKAHFIKTLERKTGACTFIHSFRSFL